MTFAEVLHCRMRESRPPFIPEPTPSISQRAYETESDEEGGWRILEDEDQTSEASTQPEEGAVSSSEEGGAKEPDASMKSIANGRTAA